MKKSIIIMMTLFMCLCLGGCTPEEPGPVNPPETEIVKDDLYSGKEADLINIAREYMIKTDKAADFMKQHDNCKHQSYLKSNENEVNVGYGWDVYLDDNGLFVVRLADIRGMGAMEVWCGEYEENDDNTFTLQKEFCDYMFDKKLDLAIEMCVKAINEMGINYRFMRQYDNYYHHMYLEYEDIAQFGYQWDVSNSDGKYHISYVEIYGLGADILFEAEVSINGDEYNLNVLTEEPKG